MQSIPQRHQYKPGQAVTRRTESGRTTIHLADEDGYDAACGVELDHVYNSHPSQPREGTHRICLKCRRIAKRSGRIKIAEGLARFEAEVTKHAKAYEAKRKREIEAREKAHEAQLAREASDGAYLELLREQLTEVGLEAGSLSNVYTDRNDSYGLGSDATVAMVDVNTLAQLIKLAKQGA